MEPATDYKAMEAAPLKDAPAKKPGLHRQKTSDLAINKFSRWVSPKMVDSCLAGAGLALASLSLHTVDVLMGKSAFPLFAPPILASSVIFFGGPSPPPVKGFGICTVGAWFAGFAIKFIFFESVYALCVAAGCLIIFFKLTGNFFVPTLGVTVTLITDGTGAMSNPLTALRWLLTPWLLGSFAMYGASHVVAHYRREVRSTLSTAKFKASLSEVADEGDDALRKIFDRYDTSGDGFLQAGELKYAWQVVTGDEMTEEEAQAKIQEVDTDGNNECVACSRL